MDPMQYMHARKRNVRAVIALLHKPRFTESGSKAGVICFNLAFPYTPRFVQIKANSTP
jgi:hypothetical protein